jgi:hypothetical protein
MRMVTTQKQDYQVHYAQLREGIKLIKMLIMREEKEVCWCKERGVCDICRAKETLKENRGLLSRIIDAEEDVYFHLDDFNVLSFPLYPAAVEKELRKIFPQKQVKTLNLDTLAQAFGYWHPREKA